MATYDLDRTELNHLMTPNIDPAVRSAVLDYLFNGMPGGGNDHDKHDDDHDKHDKSPHVSKIEVQISNGNDLLDPHAVVLDLTTANNFVVTDNHLKAIVENTATDSTLFVGGTHSVFVATGDGNDLVV